MEVVEVVLYARVSSEKQDTDLSISAQLKALRDYASKNGYHVVREFVDEAETGRTTARPAFREMISLARRPVKPFQQILIWKYSRFARSREDSIIYKAMLKKAGVSVVSINEPFEDTPTGRLLEAFIESLDEFYSDNLGQEVTRGMRESAARGFYLSSRPPYGYMRVKVKDGSRERAKLVPDPGQAKIIASIFDGILSGKGMMDIVREFNSGGIPGPKGNGWTKTGLYGMLTNEIYTGTFVWGTNSKHGLEPVRCENACSAIVNHDTFDRVQQLMKDRAPAKQHPKRVSSPFLLSGLARCGYCGKALTGRYAKSGKFAYYVCGTLDKKGKGSCQARNLNSDKFESLVIEKVKERILTRENLIELARMVNEETDTTLGSRQNEINLISESISDISHRLERLYDAIETGKLDLGDLVLRIRELRSRQDQLHARKAKIENEMSDRKVELADLKAVSSYACELQELLKEGSLAERRAFIRSFVKEVRVTGNDAVLTYTLPVPPQDFSIGNNEVPLTVRYGGPVGTIPRTETVSCLESLGGKGRV